MVDEHQRKNNPDGKTLKAIREALGWTQEQMAKLLGVSPRAIRHYEGGTRQPRFSLEQVGLLIATMRENGVPLEILLKPPP